MTDISCSREGCEIEFEPKVHNGIYCSPECRRIATNAKVLAKYYENKDRLTSKDKRVCRTKKCSTVLSKYNQESICESCKEKRLDDRLLRWGWSDTAIKKWRET